METTLVVLQEKEPTQYWLVFPKFCNPIKMIETMDIKKYTIAGVHMSLNPVTAII